MSSGSYSSQVSKNEQNTYTTANQSYNLQGANIGLTGNQFSGVAQTFVNGLDYLGAQNTALATQAAGGTNAMVSGNSFYLIAGLAIVTVVFMLVLSRSKK